MGGVAHSHRRPVLWVADRKQLVSGSHVSSFVISALCQLPPPPTTTSHTHTHARARGRRGLSPRHLWVSPDGRKASGNERKQPNLSEHIRTAVHHAANLQGVHKPVHVEAYQQLSKHPRACVCVCMRIQSVTHGECI